MPRRHFGVKSGTKHWFHPPAFSPQLVAIMKHVSGSFRLLVAGLNHRCSSMSYALPVKPNLYTNNARVHKIKCKGPVLTTQMLHIVISCLHSVLCENQSKNKQCSVLFIFFDICSAPVKTIPCHSSTCIKSKTSRFLSCSDDAFRV